MRLGVTFNKFLCTKFFFLKESKNMQLHSPNAFKNYLLSIDSKYFYLMGFKS